MARRLNEIRFFIFSKKKKSQQEKNVNRRDRTTIPANKPRVNFMKISVFKRKSTHNSEYSTLVVQWAPNYFLKGRNLALLFFHNSLFRRFGGGATQ